MLLIEKIGLDVGYGDVKAAVIRDGKLRTTLFPSVLGHAQALSSYATGLGRPTRRHAIHVVYRGVEYYLGDDALRYSRTQAGRQDSGRIGSDEERLLALAALARLGVEHACLVTGLPVLWFDEGRRRLSRSLFGEHHLLWGRKQLTITIHQVIVLPQPFGGFYSYVLDPTGQAIIPEDEIMRTYALLDVGWNTTDMTVIKNLTPEDQWAGGVQIGVRHVVAIVGDDIRRAYGLDLKPREVEQAIRQGRVEVEGRYYDLAPVIANATTSLSDQLKSTSTELWDKRRLSLVLALGGGGAVFWPAIREVFPKNSYLLPDPALANARGFCYYAQRDVWPAPSPSGRGRGG